MNLSYTLETERPPQLGLIVLQSDETLERDMRWLLPDHVELLVSRVESGEELSHDMIAGMEDRLSASATLLPRGARLMAVGYGCTSASAQIGSKRVAEMIQKGVTTPHVTDPAAALIAACKAMGIGSIGVVNPYIESISAKLCAVVEQAGIRVAAVASFNEPSEANVVRITSKSLTDAASAVAGAKNCTAVFLSCTNLRTLGVIEELEAQLNMPVLSSNQVLAWHMLRLAGITPPPGLPGRLWQI
ncbi:MAG: Asp/Glu racemase [Sulfitobacter sp.]